MQADFTRPILAIDTSTAYLSLALQSDGAVSLFHQETGNKQSEQILPQIQNLFEQNNIRPEELGAIVYAQGPGAFTGLRIGTGVAQGLATPFDIPLIGIPCLDAAAYLLPPGTGILAATDARMGEVFYGWFDTQNHRRLSPYCVGKAADITLPDNTAYTNGIGNAFSLPLPPPFPGTPQMPNAADYLKLAQSGRYTVHDAAHTELLYVRDKVALTAREQSLQKTKS